MKPRVGLDFDNTIVAYDEVFHRRAREAGMIGPDGPRDKHSIREAVRRGQGDLAWQRLQAFVYGPGIMAGVLAAGVRDFLAGCARRGIPVYVVSHKTRTAACEGPGGTDLHQAARGYMTANGLFDPQGLALAPDRVFFEPTRGDKLRRIAELGCTHFMDDLVEVLRNPAFPGGVVPVLFDPSPADGPEGLARCRNFAEFGRLVFPGEAAGHV